MYGTSIKIPFYVTKRTGFLLLGNDIIHYSRLLGPENALGIPDSVCGLSQKEVLLQMYSVQLTPVALQTKRTYVFVVLSNTSSFKMYFNSFRSLLSCATPYHFEGTNIMDEKW